MATRTRIKDPSPEDLTSGPSLRLADKGVTAKALNVVLHRLARHRCDAFVA
jgi:hypothetical protein